MLGHTEMRRSAMPCAMLVAACITGLVAAAPAGATLRLAFPGGQEVAQPNSVASLTARCPAQAPHPIGAQFGALTRATLGALALVESSPVGTRGWRITVLNMSAAPVGFGAAAVCLSAPGARFAYPRMSEVAQPQSAVGYEISCPSFAPVPIAATFALQAGSPPGAAVASWMVQGYTKQGWLSNFEFAGMRDLTNAPVGFYVGAVCSTLQITNDVQESRGHVAAGSADGWWFQCPVGWLAVGGVFWDSTPRDAAQITLAGSWAFKTRKWEVVVRNLTTRTLHYGSGIVCLRQKR